MRYLIFFLLTALGCGAYCQSASAVVFSELGEKFTLYLNSEPMNTTPRSNVKMGSLTSEFYNARIDFEDPSLPDCSNSNFAVQFNSETTYVVKKNKKGEYVIRFHSQTDGSTTSDQGNSDEGRRLADVDNMDGHEGIQQESRSGNAGVSGTTVTTTTSTTATSPQNMNESLNMGINVNGVTMGINVNLPLEAETHSSSTTVTQQTTTTHSTSSGNAQTPAPNVQSSNSSYASNDCRYPMASNQFMSARESIASKSFEDSKLTVAKQVTKANCLSCAQIKEVMSLFAFEETKLTYAKFAYDYCYNNAEYYTVNDAFTFESSIEELNNYIANK